MTQIIDLGKLRFNFRGAYSSSTAYELNDVVTFNGDSYVFVNAATATNIPPTNATYWTVMLQGAGSATSSDNVFYVGPDGVDGAGYGLALATPFASIKYACQQASPGATIFVKTGTYSEQLPITIPSNVAIVGDNQRTVVVQPKSGLSDDGVTPNNQATMFLMSDGSILNKMTFKGMTGWVPGSTPADVTTSTIKGVVVRLNPASPVLFKSPYVLECAAICSGAIGALIDGTVHATGAKTMIFHGYTVISDNGVGYWVKDGGKAEIVSCFTYYCYFGYTASGGGFIRSLNGNNSYGTWGATSRGYDLSETPLTGAIVGQQLNITSPAGNILAGATVTSASGGTATITNVQLSAGKLYVKNATGTFVVGEALTISGGGTAVVATGGLENQKGFTLIANGFNQIPVPGLSIQIAGDSYAYVIQSVSGTYTGTSSEMILILAQEKPTGSASGAVVTLRQKYSQIRLTGHDFLNIGTGGTATTNYPGTPTQPPAQGNETDEAFPGRVYYVSTDQEGNFRVGEYFRIDQATGKATLNASAFDLSGLSSLRLGSIGAQLGESINEFSSDATLSGNSNQAVPTEYAVKTYVDGRTPDQTNVAGAYLKTNGSNTFWGSAITISGDTTLSLTTGGTWQTKTYTASNDINLSGSYTWSLAGAPSQLSINSSGVLSASGTVPNGTYDIVIKASLPAGHTGYLRVKLYVGPSVAMYSTTTPPTLIPPNGAAVSYTFTQATISGGTVTHSLASGTLPSFLTLNSNGTLTGTAPGASVPLATYIFTVNATSGTTTVPKTFVWTFQVVYPQGQSLYGTNVGAGTYTWVAPAGVTSVCAVAVGAGAGGSYAWANSAGGGGGLGWKNNIAVTPGSSYTVVVGASGQRNYGSSTSSYPNMIGGTSYFINTSTVAGWGGATGGGSGNNADGAINSGECRYGGGFTGDGGGAGGNASSYQGGGGAGGYAGYGGRGYTYAGATGGGANGGGYYSSSYGTGAGGGVGLNGQGTSGALFVAIDGNGSRLNSSTSNSSGGGGEGGSGGGDGRQGENTWGYTFHTNDIRGGVYGGGGGGSGTSYGGGNGGQGGVRIIWGPGRAFPATLTADQTPAG